MAAPGRPDAESPFVIIKPAQYIPATYKDSLMDPKHRKALTDQGIFGHEAVRQIANYLGLENTQRFSIGKGEWDAHFGSVQIPQLDGIATSQNLGVGIYKGAVEHLDRRHFVVGISEDPTKTERQFVTDLKQITQNLIERPFLVKLMDSSVARAGMIYPVASLASTALLEGVWFTMGYLSGGYDRQMVNELALSKEALLAFGVAGQFLSIPGTTLLSDQVGRFTDKYLEAKVPRLGEYFADREGAGKLFGFAEFVGRRRVAVESFEALRKVDDSVTQEEFGVLYSWLEGLEGGIATLRQRQSELSSIKEQPEPSPASENIAKALQDLRQVNGRLHPA